MNALHASMWMVALIVVPLMYLCCQGLSALLDWKRIGHGAAAAAAAAG
jgi:hypothetical protein